jgi:plastocyanin
MFSIHRLRRKSALNGAFLATSASIAALVTACGGSGATTSSPISVSAASSSPAPSSASPALIGQAGFVLGTAATKVGMTYEAGTTNDTCDTCAAYFLPPAVTVHAGDIVEWDFDPTAFVRHNIVFAEAPALSNRKGLGAGDSSARGDGTWQVRFTRAGVYNYVCTFHAGMTGTVTVR